MTSLYKHIISKVNENNILAGVSEVTPRSDYDKYLNLTDSELSELSKQDLCYASYTLSQYSIAIQKNINRLTVEYNIIKKELQRALVKVYSSYDTYMGHDMILASAVDEHEHIKELDNAALQLSCLIEDNKFTSSKVDNIIGIFKSLTFLKGRD